MSKNAPTEANVGEDKTIQKTLANFFRRVASGKHAVRPWWYVIVDDDTHKWDSLSRRVFMMSTDDTYLLLFLCGLVSTKQVGNQTSPIQVQVDAFNNFLKEEMLTDFMELAKVQVKVPAGENKKKRHYLRLGYFEKDGRGKLKRFTVKDQANYERVKAPRMSQPILRDELLAKYKSVYLKFYERNFRQIIDKTFEPEEYASSDVSMKTAVDTSVVIEERQVSSPDSSGEMEALKTRIKELEDVIASKDAHIKELEKTILQVTINTIPFCFFLYC